MTKNDETSQAHSSSWSVRLVALMLVTMSVFAVFEGAAWIVYSQREAVGNLVRGALGLGQSHLDSYELADPNISGHWYLRPNYVLSHQALLAEKNNTGKWLGAAAMQEAGDVGYAEALRINSAGFKGPEIDAAHRCPRLLTLGDSVTFGVGGISYPYFMRGAFEDAKIDVEVINAGVEGYSPQNLINEMHKYLALKPEFVTIYVGWNAIFEMDLDSIRAPIPLKSLWLIRNAGITLAKIFGDTNAEPKHPYQSEMKPDANSKMLLAVQSHTPAYFKDISVIIDEFRAAGTEVYLITLMGLFQIDKFPSPTALKTGHLPRYTNNPFVLAAMAERQSTYLRLEANKKGVHLIDLQGWAIEQFMPIENYFLDSVHFNPIGLQKVAGFIASELTGPIQAHSKSCNFDDLK